MYQSFMDELKEIFSGKTANSLGMRPVEAFNPEHHVYIGVITDHVTKELFACMRELGDLNIDLASVEYNNQNIAICHSLIVEQISEVTKIIARLFWISAKGAVPECQVLDKKFFVCTQGEDWIIAYHKS